METKEIYWELMGMLEAEATVIDVLSYQGKTVLILDQSLFYPEGGGQSGDRGIVIGPDGSMNVEDTRRVEGRIYHLGIIQGIIKSGDRIMMQIDQESRTYNSRCHSAGHLISAVLEELSPGLEPVKAFHGKKAFVEYRGDVERRIPSNLAVKVNEVMQKDAPVTCQTVSFEAIQNCPFIPKNSPKNNKSWRIMQIEGMVGIPCGGTHVKSLVEIGSIKIEKILVKEGNTRVYYSIEFISPSQSTR
ncbi:MAG: alanine--tRNA ligase-related protein [Candidatus Peregrinibacteria bacterium]